MVLFVQISKIQKNPIQSRATRNRTVSPSLLAQLRNFKIIERERERVEKMSGVRQNGFLDETLKMLGLSVLSGAVVGGLILSFLPRRERMRNDRETSRNVNIFFFSLSLSIYQ